MNTALQAIEGALRVMLPAGAGHPEPGARETGPWLRGVKPALGATHWKALPRYLSAPSQYEAACRLRQARIEAMERVGAAAREFAASYVVVAGDLGDSPTLPVDTVYVCFPAIGRVGRPVLVIPGNHHHGSADGICHRPDVQASQQRYAPNLGLLARAEPVVLHDLVVLPCPLLRRHSATDSTALGGWHSL